MTHPLRTRVALSLPDLDTLIVLVLRASAERVEVLDCMPAMSARELRAFGHRQKQLDRLATRLRAGRAALEEQNPSATGASC